MKRKAEYNIGDRVLVTSTVFFVTSDNKRTMEETILKKPFEAVVVGATYRQTGRIQGTYGYEEVPFLRVDKVTLVYQVRRGMTNRIVDVLPQDLRRSYSQEPIPWRYSDPEVLSPEDRKWLRWAAQEMPRDPKTGRFIACSTLKV